MNLRQEYSLQLSGFPRAVSIPQAHKIQVRSVVSSDVDALAELMLQAYLGTIDYEGETLQDAVAEVRAYMAGELSVQPWLDLSRVCHMGSHLAGACLSGEWRTKPFIAYVMTASEWKNCGVAKRLVWLVLKALAEQGHSEVRVVITKGNAPSEHLFRGLGFQLVAASERA